MTYLSGYGPNEKPTPACSKCKAEADNQKLEDQKACSDWTNQDLCHNYVDTQSKIHIDNCNNAHQCKWDDTV